MGLGGLSVFKGIYKGLFYSYYKSRTLIYIMSEEGLGFRVSEAISGAKVIRRVTTVISYNPYWGGGVMLQVLGCRGFRV